MFDRTCAVCGASFIPRTRDRRIKYCSFDCRKQASYASVIERGVRSDPDVRAKRIAWMKANRYRYRDRHRDETNARYAAANGKRRVRLAKRQLAVAARGTQGTSIWTMGRCRRCGEDFTGRGTGGSSAVLAYCSELCSRRDHASQRRARQAGVKITKGRRYKVFESDGWACQICGDPVNRYAVVPALDAAVIDHRIPLAAGGAHNESNWQTAHFYCNCVKGAQVDFDFAA